MSNKKILIIFSIFLIFSCTKNQFAWRDARHGFTIGISGFFDRDPYQFCKATVYNFIDKYPSGKNPSKICIYYQYYTCHIAHYCPNLQLAERKKCEQDANDYWLRPWRDAKTGELLDKVAATKEICDSEVSKNNTTKQN